MTCRFVKGRTILRSFPRTASVTFTANDMVVLSSGALATVTGSLSTGVIGLIVKAVASTDSDFATSGVSALVEVPVDDNALLEIDVANGTLLTTSVGVRFGMSTAGAVDFADTTNTVVACEQYISGTKGIFTLKKGARIDGLD